MEGDARMRGGMQQTLGEGQHREAMLRRLYRAHRAHVGAPLVGEQSDMIPTTRGDLLELYTAILNKKVETPAWAVAVLA